MPSQSCSCRAPLGHSGVWGSNDPWTGGAIDENAALANPNIKFFVEPGDTHNPYFMNPDYYAKETSEQIQAAIMAFLGL